MIPLLFMTIEDEDNREFAEKLYFSYERLMYKELSKYTDFQWAKFDIMQDALVKLFPHLDYLRSLNHNDLTNYIIKTINSAAIDFIRKENRHLKFAFIEDLDSCGDETAELDARLMAIENVAAFRAAWNALDEKSKDLLHKKFILHYSNEEIGKALNVSPTSVPTLVTRARKKFIEIFRAQNS